MAVNEHIIVCLCGHSGWSLWQRPDDKTLVLRCNHCRHVSARLTVIEEKQPV